MNYKSYNLQETEKENRIFTKKYLFIFICLFILIFFSLPVSNAPYSSGNVEQWINLTNQIFYGHKDFNFSYGPLMWLLGRVSSNYNLVTYFSFLIFTTFINSIFWIVIIYLAHKSKTLILLFIVFLLYFKSLVFSATPYLLPFAIIYLIDYEYNSHNTNRHISIMHIALMAVFCSLFFYIRFFYGLLAVITFGSYLFSLCFSEIKMIKKLILFILLVAFLYVVVGAIIFHDYSSIIRYLIINRQLSFGNSVDMTINVNTRIIVWLDVALICLLCFFSFVKKPFLLLTIFLLLLVFLKLGFSRQDHYFNYFILPVSTLALFSIFSQKNKLAKIISIIILALLMCLSYISPVNKYKNYFDISSPIHMGAYVFSANKILQEPYSNRMANIYKNFKLNTNLINLIGHGTVDVYPYNNEYIFANKLKYNYRPLFQSYMTLTPTLDKMNKKFLESNSAPDFILWTAPQPCDVLSCNIFNDLDSKYALNEDPLTTSTILNNYHIINSDVGYNQAPIFLLKHNKKTTLYSQKIIGTENTSFNKWIKVPKIDDNQVLKIVPEFKFTIYGKLKNLLFRGSIVTIKYKFRNSRSTQEYRINLLNSINGIWVTPFLHSFNLSANVSDIKFVTNSSGYIHNIFNIKWLLMNYNLKKFNLNNTFKNKLGTQPLIKPPIFNITKNNIIKANIDLISIAPFDILNMAGWAYLPHGNSSEMKTYIILNSSTKKYVFITSKINRPDVAKAFHNNNFTKSGFILNASLQNIPRKKYRVELYVENKNGEGALYQYPKKINLK